MARAVGRWRAALLLPALLLAAGCASVPAPGEPAPPVALEPATSTEAPPPVAPVAAPAHDDPAPVAAWSGERLTGAIEDPVRTDLWSRVRAGFALPDADPDAVARWETYYAGRPDAVARLFERGSPYLFHIVEEVDRRGLPMELALLPFIESAFNPQAVSTARAAGMWQFIPSTGRAFELRQNIFRDDRRDVIASTRAALDYLAQLHARFDDWHLALAAYNWGQGSVQRAQQRNARLGKPTGYGSLRMPDETRQYVPKLIAVRNLVREPAAYGITLPPLENHPWFLSVPIDRDIDLALAARLAGLDEDDFLRFNPQLEPPLVLAAGTPQLLLPYDAANRFVRALAAHPGPLASWTAWVAPRTLTPAEAARLTGMPEAELRHVNRIPQRMKVAAGSLLLVPRTPDVGEDIGAELAHNGTLALTPEPVPTRRVVLKVGPKGDSVAGVARRHRLQARDVARWNKVSIDARFRPGARVVVMLPRAAGQRAAAPVRASQTKAASQRPAAAAQGKSAPSARTAKTSPPAKTAKTTKAAEADAGKAGAAGPAAPTSPAKRRPESR